MPTWHKEIKFEAGTYIKQHKFLIRQSADLPHTTSESSLRVTSEKELRWKDPFSCCATQQTDGEMRICLLSPEESGNSQM